MTIHRSLQEKLQAESLAIDAAAPVYEEQQSNWRARFLFYGATKRGPRDKHLSGSTGIIDTFLNDPPAGFKKNSFQYTLGLTYTLPQ